MDISINLQQLAHVKRKMKGVDGNPVDVLIIPIKKNQLIAGEKGTYLALTAWPLKEIDAAKKQTHLVKQKFEKELYEKLTDEQKKQIPILGNATDWSKLTPSEPEPNNSWAGIANSGDEDDLPF